MDNQHRKISGYRELNQEEIDTMNQIKKFGPMLEELLGSMVIACPDLDKRWLAIGKTHLQEGLMALTRSVAKPEFF
jgi:hypothetical protein